MRMRARSIHASATCAPRSTLIPLRATSPHVPLCLVCSWCFTESRWASLSKPATASFDLGLLAGRRPTTRTGLAELCARDGGRFPPLLPSEFVVELEQKTFTNGKDDRPLVASLYESAFHLALRNAHVLKYNELGWGDAEVAQLARALASVATPKTAVNQTQREVRAAVINELYLGGNQFGDEAAIQLLDAAAQLRGLTWLNLSDNPRLGDATFAHFGTLLSASKLNFKRLKEVRLLKTGASAEARTRLETACKARKVNFELGE